MIKILLIFGGISDGHRIMAVYCIADWHLAFDHSRSFGKDKHPVGQCDCLRQIMGDKNRSLVCLADNLCNIGRDVQTCLGIQCAERFIQKKQVGMDCHGAYQGGALPHSAGQFRRFLILKGIKAVIGKKFEDIVAICLGEGMVEFETESDILIDGAPFEEMVALQHVTDRDRIVFTAIGKTSAFVKQGALFRFEQPGYN